MFVTMSQHAVVLMVGCVLLMISSESNSPSNTALAFIPQQQQNNNARCPLPTETIAATNYQPIADACTPESVRSCSGTCECAMTETILPIIEQQHDMSGPIEQLRVLLAQDPSTRDQEAQNELMAQFQAQAQDCARVALPYMMRYGVSPIVLTGLMSCPSVRDRTPPACILDRISALEPDTREEMQRAVSAVSTFVDQQDAKSTSTTTTTAATTEPPPPPLLLLPRMRSTTTTTTTTTLVLPPPPPAAPQPIDTVPGPSHLRAFAHNLLHGVGGGGD